MPHVIIMPLFRKMVVFKFSMRLSHNTKARIGSKIYVLCVTYTVAYILSLPDSLLGQNLKNVDKFDAKGNFLPSLKH